VLQERQFERVGGNETIEVDVRLVCATQKDLKKEVQRGRFREDLYYRLNVVPVVLPPLRDRREDVMLIADHILMSRGTRAGKTLKGFSAAAQELLLRYSFPGNVRELENLVERAVALGRPNEELQVSDLCGSAACPYLGGVPQETCGFCSERLTRRKGASGEGPASADSLSTARERFERDYILAVLERVQGSRTAASKILGVSRKALWEKCKRYGIASERNGHVESEDDAAAD
jgi:DNA-binding NtrC family response regulator